MAHFGNESAMIFSCVCVCFPLFVSSHFIYRMIAPAWFVIHQQTRIAFIVSTYALQIYTWILWFEPKIEIWPKHIWISIENQLIHKATFICHTIYYCIVLFFSCCFFFFFLMLRKSLSNKNDLIHSAWSAIKILSVKVSRRKFFIPILPHTAKHQTFSFSISSM